MSGRGRRSGRLLEAHDAALLQYFRDTLGKLRSDYATLAGLLREKDVQIQAQRIYGARLLRENHTLREKLRTAEEYIAAAKPGRTA